MLGTRCQVGFFSVFFFFFFFFFSFGFLYGLEFAPWENIMLGTRCQVAVFFIICFHREKENEPKVFQQASAVLGGAPVLTS